MAPRFLHKAPPLCEATLCQMVEWVELIPLRTSQVSHFPEQRLQMKWTACNGAGAPSDVNFVIKQGWRAAARSLQIFIWTIIHRCEALDVSFPMALEQSHLDLYSTRYDQISDIRSGLRALGDSLRTDLRMRIRHRIA
ncbi:hypothetical protein PIB30_040983 [Stylosanthes scabra]|uniref:Uncharacterized protein n=1 Tax=Stylosanthes scabra TaxID=79078 RepID=A0ABU6VET8_9FABA|nr:hypothetical protein [Stylosanthes scabra]